MIKTWCKLRFQNPMKEVKSMSCKYLHVVNSVDTTTAANTVILGFSAPATATDKDKFCIKIPCGIDIPASANAYVVRVSVNGGTEPVWNKYGNPLVASDLKKNCVLKGYFGATSPHVILKELPRTYNCGCNNVL